MNTKSIKRYKPFICKMCLQVVARTGNYQKFCPSCRKAEDVIKQVRWRREWGEKNPDKRRMNRRLQYLKYKEKNEEKAKKCRLELKMDVLTHYGKGRAVCVQCGFDDMRALSIDHIVGGGFRQRRELGRFGQRLYLWLKQQGYPSGYQTLCMNCQFIKR